MIYQYLNILDSTHILKSTGYSKQPYSIVTTVVIITRAFQV